MGDQGGASSSSNGKPPREAKSLEEKGWFSTQKRRMKTGRGLEKDGDQLHQTLYKVREYEAQLHKLQIDVRQMIKAMNACLGRTRNLVDFMVDAFSGPMVTTPQNEMSVNFRNDLSNVHTDSMSRVDAAADDVFRMIHTALVNIQVIKRLSVERKPMLQDKAYYDGKVERCKDDDSKREKLERKKVNQSEASRRLQELEDRYGKLMDDVLGDKPMLMTSALNSTLEMHHLFYGSVANAVPETSIIPPLKPTMRLPDGVRDLP